MSPNLIKCISVRAALATTLYCHIRVFYQHFCVYHIINWQRINDYYYKITYSVDQWYTLCNTASYIRIGSAEYCNYLECFDSITNKKFNKLLLRLQTILSSRPYYFNHKCLDKTTQIKIKTSTHSCHRIIIHISSTENIIEPF